MESVLIFIGNSIITQYFTFVKSLYVRKKGKTNNEQKFL